MKKILPICLALFMALGIVLAPADESLGLTAGIEFGFMSLNPPGDGVNAGDTMFIRPSIAYENNELIEGLELYGELGLFMHNFRNDFGMEIDIWARAGYGIDIGFESYLGGGFRFDFTTLGLFQEGDTHAHLILAPDIYFIHPLDGIGELYAVLELPMWMSSSDLLGFDMGLNFWVGWNSDFGLGVEFGLAGPPMWGVEKPGYHLGGIGSGINFGLQSGVDGGMGWLKLKPSFTFEPVPDMDVYAHLGIYIPLFSDGMSREGMMILPRVEVGIPDVQGLTAFIDLPIFHIGADIRTQVGFSLGARFSF